MITWLTIKKSFKLIAVSFLIVAFFFLGFPSSALLDFIAQKIKDRNIVDSLYLALKDSNVIDKRLADLLRPKVQEAKASAFQMQTGYFIGDGAAKSITGLNFKPELILLKPDTTAGTGALWKTRAMPVLNVPYFIAAADIVGAIELENDGFTVNTANSNTANVGHTWAAFSGSNCSSSGTFCVGSYIGNGTSPRAITIGFQPDLVWVKQSTAVAGNWRSSSMPNNHGQYFTATNQNTDGALFTTLDATGFTVGSTNNASAAIYYYVAFKNVSGSIKAGTYAGNGTSQSIGSMGFQPDFVFVKNANAGTAVGAVYNITESYGDNSSYYTDTANLVGAITSLDSDGFSVGSQSAANGNANTIYYAAFGGAPDYASSGTFTMAEGLYTADGNYRIISGLSFDPDLVIIKGDTTQAGVFRIKMMSGDSTAYLDSATANFAGGIISLNEDGFTIGTNAAVNSSGVVYYWSAYGNAWNPDTNSGASDFFIGAYYGNGIDLRNITRLPFQPNLVSIKRNGATGGTFRTSVHSGDSSSFFAATADAANNIQTFNTDGFQVGTTANVNTAANYYWYFGFKSGTNFVVNSYSGNGTSQNITNVGFSPDNLWVKRTTAVRGVSRTNSMATDSAAPFINAALITGAITGLLSNGFSVGSATETNAGGGSYWYVGWNSNSSQGGPASYNITTGYFIGDGAAKSITGLNFKPELILLKPDTTAGTGALWKTRAMPVLNVPYFIAAADIVGAIELENDGFTVNTANSNTANVGHTWAAFSGSNCSSSGTFCVGSYIGNGTSPRAITIGFQPDLVWVKQSTAVAGNWRSSSMPNNHGQYFTATNQNTDGALFTTLDATGFTVGSTNNASAAIYYYVAFKNVSGSIKAGTYAGNGTSQSIGSMGFQPDFVFVKNANAGTAVGAVYNITESYGDNSSYYTDTANLVGAITSLDSDGFSVGSQSAANGNANTIYYAAFGGAPDYASSGTFTMAEGLYTADGNYRIISGLSFDPDLVIIKGDTTQAGVFRIKMMSGDSTAYLDSATANFAGGIISLNEDGFTIGTNAAVNSSGVVYYWSAYGNAWNPDTNSGASDFFIGAYYGNGIDLRNITRLPFQPNLVSIKRNGATGGTFRTSVHSGDSSSFFAATADAANNIQTFNTDGFQVGTTANVNTAANYYWYFGFKSGTNFVVNSYSGNGTSQNITNVGFSPDNLWVKRTTAVRGVSRTNSMATDSAAPFINAALITGAITGLLSNGFSVGSATETNAGGGSYWYVGWNNSAAVTITIGSSGTQNSPFNIPSNNVNIGGAFTFITNAQGANISQIIISASSTFSSQNYLSDAVLFYKQEAVCSSFIPADAAQFNASGVGFNSSGKATTTGSMNILSANTCVYVRLDIASSTPDGGVFDIEISNPPNDIIASEGTITPASAVAISGVSVVLATIFTQNYFRFYVDNNSLTPSDPWPAGGTDLGENTSITYTDSPPSSGDRLRIRMSLAISNNFFPTSTQDFKLQFGQKTTTCGAISDWNDLGNPGSSAIWRGYNGTPVAGTALSGNPPTPGDLLLSISDRAGTYEEQTASSLNPYRVNITEDIEYDWLVQNNGAAAGADYCFRMIMSSGAPLPANYYPTLVTAVYMPRSQNWQWFDDENNETPNIPLADENVAPVDIQNNNIIKLRMAVNEIAGIAGTNVKFKLQYSEYSDFSSEVYDLTEIGSCASADVWCYGDGVDNDDDPIVSRKLSDTTANGRHNESGISTSTFDPLALTVTEFEFTIKSSAPKINTVYFFRAYDITYNQIVVKNTGNSYPSLSTGGTILNFQINGLPAGTNTEGIVTDIDSSTTSIPFGLLTVGASTKAAQRFTVTTNAPQGYQIFVFARQGFLHTAYDSTEINPVDAENSSPAGWSTACVSTSTGCFGYHAGDNILYGGSIRFTPDDSYAKFSTTAAEEIVYTGSPVDNETTDFVYRVQISSQQAAGSYQSKTVFIIVPTF